MAGGELRGIRIKLKVAGSSVMLFAGIKVYNRIQRQEQEQGGQICR